jgi:hypothetical protein
MIDLTWALNFEAIFMVFQRVKRSSRSGPLIYSESLLMGEGKGPYMKFLSAFSERYL